MTPTVALKVAMQRALLYTFCTSFLLPRAIEEDRDEETLLCDDGGQSKPVSCDEEPCRRGAFWGHQQRNFRPDICLLQRDVGGEKCK